jgi:pilus assembly protein CpaE
VTGARDSVPGRQSGRCRAVCVRASSGRLRHRGRAERSHGERGQATLELLGLLPVLLALALAGAQLLAVGYSSVLAGNAAEAGALALAGGGDPRVGAREALPGWSRAHARVTVSGGEVRVELRPPTLLRALAGNLEVSATATVEAP